MLIKSVLPALGVQINPAEVEAAVNQAKIQIPHIAARFDEINSRLIEIERLLKADADARQGFRAVTPDPNQLPLLTESGE